MAALIYDVGMHRGEDTDFYLKKGYDVVAFEANPDLISECRNRFRAEIANSRLRIIDGAIAPASSGETITFYQNSSASVWGTINSDWKDRNSKLGSESKEIMVRRIDIENVLRTTGIPHYIKIDIEGADKIVLEALNNFDARPKYISIESEKVDFQELHNELQLLASLGYRKFKVVQQENIPGSKISSITLTGEPLVHTFEMEASGPFGDDITQNWITLEEALDVYKLIFRQYKRFGDQSWIVKLPNFLQRVARTLYRGVTGHRGPLPGWYDTHASL